MTDAEDLVGEDAKLGTQAARVSTRQIGDTTHTTKSDVAPAATFRPRLFTAQKSSKSKICRKFSRLSTKPRCSKVSGNTSKGNLLKKIIKTCSKREVYPKFKAIKAEATRAKLLEAKLVYGYFPCQSSGNDLIIYQDDEKTERLRFTFPRQPKEQRGGKNLCLADYFASVDSDVIDVVPFHLVTMGRKASEHAAELFKADKYNEYLLFHGLSVESAEALAEMWHKRIREELNFADRDATELAKLFHQGYQGSRYSFRLSCVSESRRPNETF